METPKPPSLAKQLMTAGVRKSHAYMIASGERNPSLGLALQIHRAAGLKLGPIANLSEREIAVLAKTQEGRAA